MAVRSIPVVMTEVDADHVELAFDAQPTQIYEKSFFFASQINDAQVLLNLFLHYQITGETDPTSETWRAALIARGGIRTVGGRAYPAPVVELENGNYLLQWGASLGDVGQGSSVPLMAFSEPVADPAIVPLNIGAFLRESNITELNAAAIAAVNSQTFRWGGE